MHVISIDWLVWMTSTLALFWIVPARWRHDLLIAITFAFLLYYDRVSAGYLILFSLVTYRLTAGDLVSGQRAWVAAGVVLAVLIVYKLLVANPSFDGIAEATIPLGLSYYAFRCIHFVVERYKGTIAHPKPSEYLSYLFFLPTIIVGPIHRYPAFARDRRRHRWDGAMLSEGLERILYGYVKISVLSNYLVSGLLDRQIKDIDPIHAALIVYLEIVRDGLNIYLQFSGFSDIAIGFSALLGYRVMENFHWPYFSKNISIFWQSWHISLSSWCRDYIYTTVFSLTRSPAAGALATLLVIGLWHEISVRYLIWGLCHGLALVIWQRFQALKPRLPVVRNSELKIILDTVSILLTVHFVWLSFTIVRHDSLDELGAYLAPLFGL